MPLWVEEGKKLFIYQRNIYQNSSPALAVVKKPFEWRFCAKKAAPLLAAAAVGFRKNSQLNQPKAK
jgi:hypothetical protein